MASGTFFYEYAIIFLIFFVGANLIMQKINFSTKGNEFRVLKIRFPKEEFDTLNNFFKNNRIENKLINSSNFIENEKIYLDHVYELRFKKIQRGTIFILKIL